MLERFVKLQIPILKDLFDLKSAIVFTYQDFHDIKDIVYALEAVKVSVEVLCRRDTNLLIAEVALKFMMKKLYSLKSKLSTELADALAVVSANAKRI